MSVIPVVRGRVLIRSADRHGPATGHWTPLLRDGVRAAESEVGGELVMAGPALKK